MSARINELTAPIFWKAVKKRQKKGERYGQAVFNTAYGLFPDEAGQFVASELDPYHNDNVVKFFLAAVSSLLDSEK